jgi:hypothetical protein
LVAVAIEVFCVVAATIGGVSVIVGASVEEVGSLDVIVGRAILALFLDNAKLGAGDFLSEAGDRISIIGVATKCCDTCFG